MKGILFVTLFLLAWPSSAQSDTVYWRTDTVCLHTSIQYEYIPQGGGSPQWIAWSMPEANPDTFYSETSLFSPFFSYSQEGFYRITISAGYPNGEVLLFYAEILALDPSPPANYLGEDTTYCGPFVRSLDAGNPGSNFLWNTGATTQTIQVNAPGTYTVDVSNKCYTGSFDITLTQSALPSVNLGPDGFVCHEAPKELYSGTSHHNYLWSTGETTPQITVSSAGTYSVLVTTNDGCQASDDIALRDSCPPDLYIPNSFSPNANGLNDTLTPYVNGIDSLTFRVYNRWGTLVFETSQLSIGWDGTFKGQPCQEDLYIWTVQAFDSNGSRINQKGVVVLLR